MIKKIKTYLFQKLNPVRSDKWFYYPNPKSVFGGKKSLKLYNEALDHRKNNHSFISSEFAKKISNDIEKDGYYILKNFITDDKVQELKNIVEDKLNTGKDLLGINDIQKNFRNTQPFAAIEQPFVNVPEIIEIALDERIIDITSSYLNCKSALGTCNLRKSYVNDIKETTTQLFHVDPNSPKFLKCFIYLNDVDMDGGPFCYIKGSHRKKFQGWNTKYRWSTSEIHNIYGEENVVYLTASKGDLIIADTNAFHRGIKPIKNDRIMLTIDYTCHHEGFEENSKFLFPKNEYDKLTNDLKDVASFVELV
jgi:hypothetical protein